jgi:hypothetical protein
MALLTSADSRITPKSLLAGFIAAAISVVIFHQGMFLILNALGLLPARPWNLAPTGPLGVPTLLNQMFWGGLWGMLFSIVWPHLPGRDFWLKGMVFGWLGPMLLGNWILIPLIKGGPFFAGLVPMRMLVGALIAGAFGLGLGLIYEQLRRRI